MVFPASRNIRFYKSYGIPYTLYDMPYVINDIGQFRNEYEAVPDCFEKETSYPEINVTLPVHKGRMFPLCRRVQEPALLPCTIASLCFCSLVFREDLMDRSELYHFRSTEYRRMRAQLEASLKPCFDIVSYKV